MIARRRPTIREQPDVRPATSDEAADVRRMHAANRLAWDEAAEHYEGGWTGRSSGSGPAAPTLFPVEEDLIGDLHGRVPARDPPPVRRGRGHALAVEPGRRGGHGRRLQPADARPRPAAGRGGRCAGELGPRPTSSTCRTTSTGPPTWSTRVAARSCGSRTSTAGRPGLAPPARAGGPPRPVRGAPGRVAVRRRRRRRLDADRLRLLRRPRGVARLGARLHRAAVASPTTSSPGSSRGRGRSARS